VLQRVRPGGEGHGSGDKSEIDDSDDRERRCGREVSDQFTGKRQARDCPDEARKPGDLEGGNAAEHHFLRHQRKRIHRGAEEHQQDTDEVGSTGTGGNPNDQSAQERDQTSDHEHPRKTLPEQDAREHADQDRGKLNQHRGGAGVDVLLASIECNAVDREPGDANQSGERPLPSVHPDERASNHHRA